MFSIAKNLHKKSARTEQGLFLIEGHREIKLAREHGVEIVHVFDESNTSKKNLERISYCGEVVAVAKTPERNLREFRLPDCLPDNDAGDAGHVTVQVKQSLIVILDRLEKPGNIGAIIRTADAAGVSAVFVCGGTGDLENPNLIRASLGAVFSMPVFNVTSAEAAGWLEQQGIPAVAAVPGGDIKYFNYNYAGKCALVIGSEAEGVSEFWKSKASGTVSIPMTGAVNSLNASVSAAILIYEVIRQGEIKNST